MLGSTVILAALVATVSAACTGSTCGTCLLDSGCGWDGSECASAGVLKLNCVKAGWTCDNAYKCSTTPPAYNESFARNQLWRLHAAHAAQNVPTDIGFIGCMKAADASAVFLGRVQVACTYPGLLGNDQCITDVFALPGSNAIVVSTLGTAGNTTQIVNVFLNLLVPIIDDGVLIYWKNAYSSLWPGVKSLLTNAYASTSAYKDYNLVFSGHSLGAAIAVLMSEKATSEIGIPKEKVSSITFGQPRIGTYDFLDRFFAAAPNHFRIINQNDIITTLPAAIGVYHTKYPVQYKNGMTSAFLGNGTICHTAEDPNCAADFLAGLPSSAHNTYFGIPSYPEWRATNCSYVGI